MALGRRISRRRCAAFRAQRAARKRAEGRMQTRYDMMRMMSRYSPFLPTPIMKPELWSSSSSGVAVGLCAVQGWRRGQEDAHIAELDFDGVRSLSLFAVFDGHGGADVSQFCACNFGSILKQSPGYGARDYAQALYETFFAVDEALRSAEGSAALKALRGEHAATQRVVNAEARDDDECDGDDSDESDDDARRPGFESGCTATVVLVDRLASRIWCANAGDSRAVLCRGGVAVPLSVDHKPEDPIEKARVENAGGVVTKQGRIDGNLNLSRALGDLCYKADATLPPEAQKISCEPDVYECTLGPQDTELVLMCDGITGSLEDQPVVDACARAANEPNKLALAAAQVCLACIAPDTSGDGTGCDNETLLFVKLNSKKHAPKPSPVIKREPTR